MPKFPKTRRFVGAKSGRRPGAFSAASRPALTPFEAEIRDMASDGRGVALDPTGKTCFVRGAWLGEMVRVQPTDSKRSVSEGVVTEVLHASPDRVTPPCALQGHTHAHCGGCPWMMVEYAAQLAQKKQWLTKALARLQSADCEPEVMAAPQPLGYRNRAQLKTDGERLGFSAAGTRAIVDVPVCLVLNAGCQAELSALRAQLPNSQWRPRKGREWSTLDLDDSGRPPLLNQRQPFRQGNDVQNQRMQAWVVEQLQRMSSPEKTVELFCGSGNFTQLLCASTSGKVVAVEGVAATLAPLATQASNQLLPVVGDLYDEDFVRTLTHGHQDAELLFLDPPRDGLRHRQALLAGLPQLTDVLYISCNIATWERDCRDFIAGGFRVESLGLVDLFPHTPHVEILSRLRRAP